MDELEQRHLRLLYRQRGSASRTIDYDVVIEDDEPRQVPIFPDMPEDGQYAGDEDDSVESPIVEESKVTDDIGYTDAQDYVDQPVNVDLPNFDTFSLSKLSTPITSMATMDVLKRLLQTVMESIIDEKTMEFGSQDGAGSSKLRLKLEIKILREFLAQCIQDLGTISGLNLSNNDLLYRLKQISLLKNTLSTTLLEIRSTTNSLRGQNKLDDEMLQLNNLKRINQLIREQGTNDAPNSSLSDSSILDTKSGLLNKLA